jgi:hypothetical protein
VGSAGHNLVSFLVLWEGLHNPDDPYMREGAEAEMAFGSDRFAWLEEAQEIRFAEEEKAILSVG